MSECVAVINAGSSSIKFALYEIGQTQSLMFRGLIEKIGVPPQMVARDGAGTPVAEEAWPVEGFNHARATEIVLRTSRDLLEGTPVMGVGHRVVHGGTDFAAPTLIDAKVISSLSRLIPLPPLP